MASCWARVRERSCAPGATPSQAPQEGTSSAETEQPGWPGGAGAGGGGVEVWVGEPVGAGGTIGGMVGIGGAGWPGSTEPARRGAEHRAAGAGLLRHEVGDVVGGRRGQGEAVAARAGHGGADVEGHRESTRGRGNGGEQGADLRRRLHGERLLGPTGGVGPVDLDDRREVVVGAVEGELGGPDLGAGRHLEAQVGDLAVAGLLAGDQLGRGAGVEVGTGGGNVRVVGRAEGRRLGLLGTAGAHRRADRGADRDQADGRADADEDPCPAASATPGPEWSRSSVPAVSR